jgi:hypothetical protein
MKSKAEPTRPDIVVQSIGADPRLLLLELKASRNAAYLGQGFRSSSPTSGSARLS